MLVPQRARANSSYIDQGKCEILVGFQSLYGRAQAYHQWNATFADYLTAESGTNCTFTIVPLDNETAVYEAVGNATVDLIYANPGMHMCLEVQSYQHE